MEEGVGCVWEDRLILGVGCVVFVCCVEERTCQKTYCIGLQLFCAKLLVPDLPCCFRVFCAYTLAVSLCVLGSITVFSSQEKVLVEKLTSLRTNSLTHILDPSSSRLLSSCASTQPPQLQT